MKRYSRLTVFWILIVHLPASATIINIPGDYFTIQEGIDASADGDTVLVQPGIYVENVNFNGHNIVVGSLFLMTGDTAYIAETVINGNLSGPVVSFESGEDSTTVICGFMIQNGYWAYGAGIYCMDSDSQIRANIINENWADMYGGGIYCENSNTIIRGNIIMHNIAHNTQAFTGTGGGIYIENSNAVIDRNIIASNGSHAGGGILLHDTGSIVTGNLIANNSAFPLLGIGGTGGGVACYSSSPLFVNNTIIDNEAYEDGGGIYSGSSNCLIINNTLTGNSAEDGGAIYCQTSSDIIINSICWHDTALTGYEIYGSPDVTYSNISGGWEGEGNINALPRFRSPNNGDYHLMSTACGNAQDSPCIDAGSPAIIDSLLDCSWGLGTILSDMGAYGGGDSATVGIIDQEPRVPDRFALLQNYPNPFNAKTIIRYNLPSDSDVIIEIYDILGRIVETLAQEKQPAGYHQTVWNANSRSSGIYFYRIQAGNYSESRSCILLK